MYIFWIQGLVFLLAQVDVLFTATFDEEKLRIFLSKKDLIIKTDNSQNGWKNRIKNIRAIL